MTTPEPTITICLSRADAEWWRDVIDVPSVWGHKDHANRVLCALIAALASERTEGRCDHKAGEVSATDAPDAVKQSPCCAARVWMSLADGVLTGSCAACGQTVVRVNPHTGIEEWTVIAPPDAQ